MIRDNSTGRPSKDVVVKTQFISYKLKTLCIDEDNNSSLIGEANKVIDDILYTKNFMLNLLRTKNVGEATLLFDRAGYDYIFELINTPVYYNSVADLIRIQDRISFLKRKISKMIKKHETGTKEYHKISKEKNKLTKLCKDGPDAIRRYLGIPKKKNLMDREFGSLKELVGRDSQGFNYGFDGIGFDWEDNDSGFGSDYYLSSDYSSLDESEFDRFKAKRTGGKKRAPAPKRSRFEEDEDLDYDDYDQDYQEDRDGDFRLTSRLDKLETSLDNLSHMLGANTVRRPGYVPAPQPMAPIRGETLTSTGDDDFKEILVGLYNQQQITNDTMSIIAKSFSEMVSTVPNRNAVDPMYETYGDINESQSEYVDGEDLRAVITGESDGLYVNPPEYEAHTSICRQCGAECDSSYSTNGLCMSCHVNWVNSSKKHEDTSSVTIHPAEHVDPKYDVDRDDRTVSEENQLNTFYKNSDEPINENISKPPSQSVK